MHGAEGAAFHDFITKFEARAPYEGTFVKRTGLQLMPVVHFFSYIITRVAPTVLPLLLSQYASEQNCGKGLMSRTKGM